MEPIMMPVITPYFLHFYDKDEATDFLGLIRGGSCLKLKYTDSSLKEIKLLWN